MNTGTLARMGKRGYSREFGPRLRTPESRRRIHVDWVPPTLYDKTVARAKREGVSLRALILKLLSEWLNDR